MVKSKDLRSNGKFRSFQPGDALRWNILRCNHKTATAKRQLVSCDRTRSRARTKACFVPSSQYFGTKGRPEADEHHFKVLQKSAEKSAELFFWSEVKLLRSHLDAQFRMGSQTGDENRVTEGNSTALCALTCAQDWSDKEICREGMRWTELEVQVGKLSEEPIISPRTLPQIK